MARSFALILAVAAAGSVLADTYTTTGFGGRLTEEATWRDSLAPKLTDASAEWQIAAYGADAVYTNDFDAVPYVTMLAFTGDADQYPGAKACALDYGKFRIGTGGLTVADSLPTGSVVTVSSDLVATGGVVNVRVPSGRTLALDGSLTDSGVKDQYFVFAGPGTNVLRGSYSTSVSTHSGSGKYPSLTGGTTVVEGLFSAYKLGISDGARVVIPPGGQLRATGGGSRVGVATIDVNGGTLQFADECNIGVTAGLTTIIVRNGGIFDPTQNGSKCGRANGNVTDIYVLDGATMFWRAPAYYSASDAGTTRITIDGGTVIEGAYACFFGSGGNANVTNSITLKSGKLIAQALSQRATKSSYGKDTVAHLYCDGGTLRATSHDTAQYIEGHVEKFHTFLRGGGLVFDTNQYARDYNGVIENTDLADGKVGPLVKRGSATLTLSANNTYTSSNIVFSGTLTIANTNRAALCVVKPGAKLQINNPTYYANAVALERTGRLSFTGTKLTLSSLATDGGEIVLASGQSLALDSYPTVTTNLCFSLASFASGNAYEVLTCPGADDALVAKCRLVNPSFTCNHTFTRSGDSIRLTVSGGNYSTWNVDADAKWSTASSWSGSAIPNSSGTGAYFAKKITANRSVNVDMDVTVGKILFENSKYYTLANGSDAKTVTLDRADGGVATITVSSGYQYIRPSIHLAGPTYVSVASGARLFLTGNITGAAGAYLVVKGPGTLYFGGTVDVPVYAVDSAYLDADVAGVKLTKGLVMATGTTLCAESDLEIAGSYIAPEGVAFYTPNNSSILVKDPPANVEFKCPNSSNNPMLAIEDFDGVEKIVMDYSTVVYKGAYDGVCDANIEIFSRADRPSTLKVASGAGDLTFTGSLTLNAGTGNWGGSYSNRGEYRFIGASDATLTIDTVLHGSIWNLMFYRFGGGRVRFGPHFGFSDGMYLSGDFRIGGDSGCPTYASMADGANINGQDLVLSAEANATDAAVSFVQEGGAIRERAGFIFGSLKAAGPNSYTMLGGSYADTAGDWNTFRYGPSSLVISNSATMSLGSLAFGSQTNTTVSYSVSNIAASTEIRLGGGVLEVRNGLDLAADLDASRNNRLIAGAGDDDTLGVLTLPAAVRTQGGDGLFGGGAYTAIGLDGAYLGLPGVLTKTVTATASLTNYFPNLGAFTLGAGGIVDTCGNDITNGVPVTAASTNGVLMKIGAGNLVFNGTSTVFGGLDVREGDLTMKFREDSVRPLGDGVVAYWDFDGENPYADKSGNGHDLAPYDGNCEGADPVAFVEEDAFDGKSARWTSLSGLVAFTNEETEVTLPYNENTVIFFLRLASWDPIDAGDGQYKSIFSTAVYTGEAEGYSATAVELHSQDAGRLTACSDALVQCDVSSALTLGVWHSVAVVRRAGTVRLYVDGNLVGTSEDCQAALQFLPYESGRKHVFTLGRGSHEKRGGMQGMMVDDVAIYRRPLAESEVRAYHASRGATIAMPVAVAEGSTLDLSESSLVATRFSGSGTVRNGTLKVDGALAADCASVERLAFGPHGVIDFGREVGDLLKTPEPVPVVWFTELDEESAANVTAWKAVNVGRSSAQRYIADVTVDWIDRAVKVHIRSGGLTILFR